jgi:sugar lactone lactonase YvrE
LPGNAGADLALAIDPSETAFWTADYRSGNVWEVDVASGNILHQWNGGAPGVTAGLAVFAGVCVSPQCIVP